MPAPAFSKRTDTLLSQARVLSQRRGEQVMELEDPRVGRALVEAAREQGFRPTGSTIEVEGICASCAAGSVGIPAAG